MNFFEHQDHAHKLTRRLIWLFVLAVICIVFAVNATLALAWLIAYPVHNGASLANRLPNHFFFTNTLITLLFIIGGTLLELWRLRDGGDVVAKMAGGRLLQSASYDPAERRLLNIVEEIAIASGISVPKVYVMGRENGINAFAAGYGPNEAVVAVTHGAVTRLSRDELQGVIGHEFSHILNGDMRLNLRLMGVLYGILLIAMFGGKLMSLLRHSSGSRNKNGGAPMLALFVAGLCLWIVGYIGVFFGRLIKSAVSRQREFLADASAIQFTRNPDGIGGALRKIGGLSKAQEDGLAIGSQIHHINAENLSHMFLGAARPNFMSGWLATHPPLEERIRRIYGRSMPLMSAPEAPVEYPKSTPPIAPLPYVVTSLAEVQASTPSSVFPPHTIPETLRQAARIPITAQKMMLALLHDPVNLPNNLNTIDRDTWFLALKRLEPELHLSLIDLAIPALKELNNGERERFLANVDQVIKADGRVTLKEFVLQTILSRRLNNTAGRAVPIRYASLETLRPAAAIVLSLVAHVTSTQSISTHTASEVFEKGAGILGLSGLTLLARDAIHFDAVNHALNQLNELAPLKKPLLIKALMSVAGHPVQSSPCNDLLRAISTALDVPTPMQL